MGVPCNILNKTCGTYQAIFRPQLEVLIIEIMETFVYMRFFPFSKCLLVSNMVSLCALKVRLLECEKIEKLMFSSIKRSPKP